MGANLARASEGVHSIRPGGGTLSERRRSPHLIARSFSFTMSYRRRTSASVVW